MKVVLENLGVFRYAEYELSDLNIICGDNNSGKTYAMYALYGFLDFWRNAPLADYKSLSGLSGDVNKLVVDQGVLRIPLKYDVNSINSVLNSICLLYSQHVISGVFAAKNSYFKGAKFLLSIANGEVKILDSYNKQWRLSSGDEVLSITKESSIDELLITLLINDKSAMIQYDINGLINMAIREIIFDSMFPEPFIASAERTGAVIFDKELDLNRNSLVNALANGENITPQSLFAKLYSSSYPLPVRRNIDHIRNLENIAKNDSYISINYPSILELLNEIVGGTYKIDKSGLYYVPFNKKSAKLTMVESSSSVRALLDVSFYLRYLAKPGEILIIDEPELNLHPKNQRKIARLFAMLANIGIRVFVSTHSDYIIKELNTLIMLSNGEDKDQLSEIAIKYGYNLEMEKLNIEQVRVYISERKSIIIPGSAKKEKLQTLVKAEVDPFYGIEAKSFDDTINEMNKLQRLIAYGV
jgi:hypothetical protein